METPKPGRYKKSAVAVAIVGVIVGLLSAQGHYQVALVVLSALCLVVLISAWLTVATLREQVSENEFAALHDPLTELPNRLLFHDRVHQALLAARRSGSRAAVIMLDVDRFKEINDSLGHHTGDLVLYEVGRRLTETLRVSDSVARLNGDEFAVLLPEVDDDLSAAAAATKVREALAVPFPVEQLEVEMEATAGIALYPDHGEDPETLLQHAEVAMYNAKHSHSGHELYAAARDEFSPASLRLVGELRRGISNGELELHYLPKVRLSDKEVVGVEALVRWQHPEHGLMSPDSFIPLAEHTGLIRPLTLEVLAMALDQVASWRKDGLELGVAVNLSPRNVMDPDLPRQIKQLLEERDLPANLLELEITENTIMADPEARPRGPDAPRRDAHLAGRGRLRHRLLVARLSQAAPDHLAEDRPLVRHLDGVGRGRRRDRPLDDRARPQPRHARGRRGRGERVGAERAARPELRLRPGLPPQPPARGRRARALGARAPAGRALQNPPSPPPRPRACASAAGGRSATSAAASASAPATSPAAAAAP